MPPAVEVTSIAAPAATLPPIEAQGVALYTQVASRLRAEIEAGRWAVNERLPTVAELARRYQVAVVTVRQALQLLKKEALVTMHRGRGSFVVGRPAGPSEALREAINDPLASADCMVIEVLERRRDAEVPAALHGGAPLYARYHFIRKRHLHDHQPFCVATLYVASEIFSALPRGAESQRKINALIAERLPGLMVQARTSVTVAMADVDMAHQLGCLFGAPVVRVRRRVLDAQGRVVYAGLFLYRGDRFILDFDSSQDLPTSGGPRPLKARRRPLSSKASGD
ncbi:MAG: GntR family transcriptional regulator [Proteobacteria bacterium]|nr:GntR family transcriptional regulator [Pseudomonadota bacterium]